MSYFDKPDLPQAPRGPTFDPDLEKIFWDHITVNLLTGCWEWDGRIGTGGYGLLQANRVRKLAHRASYEINVGPILDGLQIDHLCRNRRCVNPKHLEQVTMQENVRRGEGVSARNARKTHCPYGHPYSGENLLVSPGGSRKCKICQNKNGRVKAEYFKSELGISRTHHYRLLRRENRKVNDNGNV